MAEPSGGDPQVVAMMKSLAPYAPGAAGAFLSMMFGEGLSRRGKAVSLFMGMASVLWFAPFVVSVAEILWPGPFPTSGIGLIGFSSGFFGMALFAGLAQAVARYSKDPLRLVKFQAGGLSVGGDTKAEDGKE